MKKIDIISKLNSLSFDVDDYCIISGGILVMYGIREETEDVDLLITKKLFNKIKNKYTLNPRFDKFPDLYELDDSVEVRVSDFDHSDVSFIDGYPVWSLEKQLEWKINNHREKDLKDIELIRDYLNKNK